MKIDIIKHFREKHGCGLMPAKNALTHSAWDEELAEWYLKEHGLFRTPNFNAHLMKKLGLLALQNGLKVVPGMLDTSGLRVSSVTEEGYTACGDTAFPLSWCVPDLEDGRTCALAVKQLGPKVKVSHVSGCGWGLWDFEKDKAVVDAFCPTVEAAIVQAFRGVK